MNNINFVPDEYIQNSESRRTNLIYLALFVVVMTGLVGSFATIKIRQRMCRTEEENINMKMAQVPEALKQSEELQKKYKAMMKTVLTAAELLEPVPRSILLASLTNNLPSGTSLLKLHLVQKESKAGRRTNKATTKYQAVQAEKDLVNELKSSQEKSLETSISIEGIAPSDLQVAAYIEHLSNSALLDSVALVESKEYKIDDTTFRQFKLTAMLRKNVNLSDVDLDEIRVKETFEGQTAGEDEEVAGNF